MPGLSVCKVLLDHFGGCQGLGLVRFCWTILGGCQGLEVRVCGGLSGNCFRVLLAQNLGFVRFCWTIWGFPGFYITVRRAKRCYSSELYRLGYGIWGLRLSWIMLGVCGAFGG